MISNEDYSTNGKSLHHKSSTRSKGSMSTVRVGSRNLPLYPLVIVCLGLLNTVLMLTAVVIGIYCGKVFEESNPHEITAEALFIEKNQFQIIMNEAVTSQKEAEQAFKQQFGKHQQLKLQLERNKTLSDNLQKQLELLLVERATLQSSTSDMLESCGRCLPGWFLLNTSCYFHAKSQSNPLKNWMDSRADCISRGADLAVIDTQEEQVNLFEHLPKLGSSGSMWWKRSSGLWIGLTDIQTEGTWMWVNNVVLRDGGYWMSGEPNDYGAEGEDCAALVNRDNPMKTWFDVNCDLTKEWLCEMEFSHSG